MGFRALEGSWLEGQDALVSTAVGALTFWLLGAIVGLLVSFWTFYGICNAQHRDRRARHRFTFSLCFEGTTAQVLLCLAAAAPPQMACYKFIPGAIGIL